MLTLEEITTKPLTIIYKEKNNKIHVFVGAPLKNMPSMVHPTDQTDPNMRVHLYFDKITNLYYIINPSTYENIE